MKARKGRQVFDDGLDRVERVHASAITLEEMQEAVRGTGFEGMLRPTLESLPEKLSPPGEWPPRYPEYAGSVDNPLSLATAAQWIRRYVAGLRRVLQNNPEHEWIVCTAVQLGYRIGDATWRSNRGPLTRTGLETRVRAAILRPKLQKGQRGKATKQRQATIAFAEAVDARRRRTSDEMRLRDAVRAVIKQEVPKWRDLSSSEQSRKVDTAMKRYTRGKGYQAEDESDH